MLDQPFISLDLLPTIVKLAGGTLENQPLSDGVDVWPLLTGSDSVPERDFYFEYRNFSAFRAGKYKILRTKTDAEFMLFDLSIDLGESHDLADQHPGIKAEMVTRFSVWKNQFAE
ncbi:MAG: hypothetical protein R3C11_26320 [Planctomycetaceae bacterium]